MDKIKHSGDYPQICKKCGAVIYAVLTPIKCPKCGKDWVGKNPIRHAKLGWFWGSVGPQPTKEKLMRQVKAIYAGGYRKNPTGYILSESENDELVDLYHLAQTVVGHKRYDRLVWTANEFHKTHPTVSTVRAYLLVDYITRQKNPTLVMPIKSKQQLEHMFKAQKHLNRAGVSFDSGTQLSPMQRHWELDWSLKGATMKNPILKRNPGLTNTIGNAFGVLGILAIPLFIWLIIWADNRAKR